MIPFRWFEQIPILVISATTVGLSRKLNTNNKVFYVRVQPKRLRSAEITGAVRLTEDLGRSESFTQRGSGTIANLEVLPRQ